MSTADSELFNKTNYQIQHQLGLLKEKFKIEDETGKPILWVATPSMSLKKEFHVYADEGDSQEVLDIKIHKLIEFADTWDITDPASQVTIGTIKYEAMKSLMSAKWQILDPSGAQIAEVAENTAESLENVVAGGLVPRKYAVTVNGTTIAKYDQSFMSLMLHFTMDFSTDTQHQLDRRLGIAAGVIVAHKALVEKSEGHNSGLGAIGV